MGGDSMNSRKIHWSIWDGPSPGIPGHNIEKSRALYASGRLRIMGEVVARYQGLSPSDAVLDPYFALAESLDIPACIHVGMSLPGITQSSPKFKVSVRNPLLLEELLNRHPKLRVWIAHLGFPFLAETIGIPNVHPQVYADASAWDWLWPREGDAAEQGAGIAIKEGLETKIMGSEGRLI
jgi:predicted TIM-barrel fold metal-dependent hydrolase